MTNLCSESIPGFPSDGSTSHLFFDVQLVGKKTNSIVVG